ncbi:MAG: hypothetical protein N2C14_25875 [Planctomycetales bacterium]
MRWNNGMEMGVRWIAAASLILVAGYVNGSENRDQLRSEMDRLDSFLSGPHSESWKRFLLWETLEDQVAPGVTPNGDSLNQVYEKFSAQENGLELSPFARVRSALGAYVAEIAALNAEALPELAKKAAARPFHAPSPKRLARAKAHLQRSLAGLERQLRSTRHGSGWRKHLRLDQLHTALSAAKPSTDALTAAGRQFTSGHPGLELTSFASTGRDLGQYRDLLAVATTPDAANHAKALLEKLAGDLGAYAKTPTPESAAAIGQALNWLETAGHCSDVTHAARANLSRPNVLLQISHAFVSSGANRVVDDQAPVRDFILGTTISGTGHTTGDVRLEFAPNPSVWAIDLLMTASTQSRTVGRNGPAIIHSDGVTDFTSRKQILIDANGVRPLAAQTNAVTRTTTRGVSSKMGFPFGGFVKSMASRQVAKKKGQAQRIAARHAEGRINKRFDEKTDEKITNANQRFQNAYRNPLLRRGAFPGQIEFATTDDRIQMAALHGKGSQLGAPNSPPALEGEPAVAFRLHQSAVNNIGDLFAGQTASESDTRRNVKNLLGFLPDNMQAENPKPGSLVFADENPVRVTIADGALKIVVRAKKFQRGDDVFPPAKVTVTYKPEQDKAIGWKLVRQGKAEAVPPNFQPGDKLGTSELLKMRLVAKFFEKLFAPETPSKPLELKGEWKKAGKLTISRITAEDGWLTFALDVEDRVRLAKK